MPLLRRSRGADDSREGERAAPRTQIELLEDESRSGMERDTLVLLDQACARLGALDAEEPAAADAL
jgi:hypothetical protein